MLNHAGRRRRIPPFAASRLKRVQAKPEVRKIGKLNDFPDILPGWSDGRPAPVFIGETEVVFGEHVT